METQQTLSDGEFYELFDLLEEAGGDSAQRCVQICDAIPAAKCTQEEAVLYAAARTYRVYKLLQKRLQVLRHTQEQ